MVLALLMAFAMPLTLFAAEVEDTEAGIIEVVRDSEDEIPSADDGWRLFDTTEDDEAIYGQAEIVGYENGEPIYGEAPIVGYEQGEPIYGQAEIIGYENGEPIYGEAEIIGYENGEPIYGEAEIIGYEQGEPIYGEAPIVGYENGEPIYGDTPIVGYEQGEPIYGEEKIVGYEQKSADAGIVSRPDIKESGNSGSYSGTEGNGQKIGSDDLTKVQRDLGIGTQGSTINVPAGLTITVRVQSGTDYSYIDVTGPINFSQGNNMWIHDIQEAKVDDESKPIYGRDIIGYKNGDPIYGEAEIIGYENGEPIYGERPIVGYENGDPIYGETPIDGYVQIPVYGEAEIIGYENGEPIYGERPLLGYEQGAPVYGEAEIIGYENGEPIYGERPIVGYEVITKDYYKRYIWVEDENGDGGFRLTDEGNNGGPEIAPAFAQVVLSDNVTPLASFQEVLPVPAIIEEEFMIIDEEIPLMGLPQTGSMASMGTGMVGVFAALSSLAGAGATLLKKEEE